MIDTAITALRDGKFILIYDFDNRERETDFAMRADAVTPRDIVTMRRDGGGLICTAIHPAAAARIGLPFAVDLLKPTGAAEKEGDIPYDRKNHSSFSLWVNHRDTYTGVTDRDRALTITKVAEEVKKSLNGGGHDFFSQFRSPGHAALLRAADGLLAQRQGQTELSIALAEMAGVTPAVTICEMLDDESGLALSKTDAQAYGRRHGIPFVTGDDILARWEAERDPSLS